VPTPGRTGLGPARALQIVCTIGDPRLVGCACRYHSWLRPPQQAGPIKDERPSTRRSLHSCAPGLWKGKAGVGNPTLPNAALLDEPLEALRHSCQALNAGDVATEHGLSIEFQNQVLGRHEAGAQAHIAGHVVASTKPNEVVYADQR